MKKLIVVSALFLIGAIAISQAALPISQPYQGSGPYWNTTLIGSTNPATGTPAFVVLPSITKVSGSTTYSGRNCLTRIVAQLTYGSTVYVLDSGTTVYEIEGAGIASSTGTASIGQASPGTVGTFNLVWGELGPFCGTAGSSMTINVPAPASATVSNVVNYEGFTFFPYSANNGN